MRGYGIWPFVRNKWPDSVSTHLVQKSALSMEEKRKFQKFWSLRLALATTQRLTEVYYFPLSPLSELIYGDRIIVNFQAEDLDWLKRDSILLIGVTG